MPTLILVLALGICASGCNKGQAAAAMPIPEVEVATVETRDVPMYGEWVATLDGYSTQRFAPKSQATSSAETTQRVRSSARAKSCSK